MGSGIPGLDDSGNSSANWSLLSRSTEQKRMGGGDGLGTAGLRHVGAKCHVSILWEPEKSPALLPETA